MRKSNWSTHSAGGIRTRRSVLFTPELCPTQVELVNSSPLGGRA
jgi:hypothetical protein